MPETIVYTSGSATVDELTDALGNVTLPLSVSAKIPSTVYVTQQFGGSISAVYGSVGVLFVADNTYQVAAVTGNSPIIGSGIGASVLRISAAGGGLLIGSTSLGINLLTNSLNFTTSGTVRGSLVNSVGALQLAVGDVLTWDLSGGSSAVNPFAAGAISAMTVTLNRI